MFMAQQRLVNCTDISLLVLIYNHLDVLLLLGRFKKEAIDDILDIMVQLEFIKKDGDIPYVYDVTDKGYAVLVRASMLIL
jgi:hypothetical protein